MSAISVIVPVYNVKKYLNRCVDSILNQTFTDFELILVDDGSVDNSGIICDEYAKKDDRVIVIHTENNGPGAARNTGLDWAFENSDSNWIAFIDSDDTVHPDYLSALYNAAKKYKKDISVCGYIEFVDADELDDVNFIDNCEIFDVETYYCERFTTCPWGKLIKKELLSDIRFPEGKKVIGEDAFVMYKALFKCEEVVYNSSQLYYYYQTPNSLMRSAWSPNKMLAIKAAENQIAYMLENNHFKAYKQSIWDYANVVYTSIIECEECSTYSKELKTMKKILKNHIKKNKSILRISENKNSYFYKCAMPIRYKMYLYTKKIMYSFSKNSVESIKNK